MNEFIELLMIDDDKDNFISLKNAAFRNDIQLRWAQSLEEGIELLKNEKSIMGVILDGRGNIKLNQEIGTESDSFVHEALTQLRLIEENTRNYIPKCVLTAWYEKLKESLEGRVMVFDKKQVSIDSLKMEEMFNFLKSQVNSLDKFKIRSLYNDVFVILKKYGFSQNIDNCLMGLLVKANDGNFVKEDFNSMRSVLEAVCKRLNDLNGAKWPIGLFHQDSRPNWHYWKRYLAGMSITATDRITTLFPENSHNSRRILRVPEHVLAIFEFLIEVLNPLSHDYKYNWTKYVQSSVLMGLCELFIWFDNQDVVGELN